MRRRGDDHPEVGRPGSAAAVVRGMTDHPVASLLVGLQLWTSLAIGAAAVAPLAAAAAELPPLPGPPSEAVAEEIWDRMMSGGDIPYEEKDYFIDALVDELDYEPLAAFEYVRDRIRLDPYPGILRGARGTLAAKAGGAHDQALLLQALLEEMGVETRLVAGPLGAEHAVRALEQSRATPLGPSHRLMSPAEQARIEARTDRNMHWLRSALSGEKLGGEDTRIQPPQLRQHLWLQARIDGNEWQDLDPSFADAEPGEAHAKIESYPKEPDQRSFHTVSIRVSAEVLAGGDLVESVLLDEDYTAVQLQQQPVFLMFSLTNSGTGGTIASRLSPTALMSPVLTVGDEIIKGLTVPGASIDIDASEARRFLFGDGNTTLSGLYLDVAVTSPDGTATNKRRVLLDRVPARARFAGKPDKTDLVESGRIGEDLAVFSDLHQILVSTGGINPYAALVDLEYTTLRSATLLDEETGASQSPWDALLPTAAANFVWLAGVEQLLAGTLAVSQRLRGFIGSPQVYVRSYINRAGGDQLVVGQLIDLLHDDVTITADNRIDDQAVAMERVRYGAFKSAIETVSGEALLAMTPGSTPTARSASMITDGKSQRLTAVEELDRESWVSQALLSDVSSEQLVFTGEDLEASHSWWSVDPATGTTASRGFSGVGYTLLPRWVRLRLTSVATKIHYVDDAKLLKWARDTTKKAKMANKARAANSRYANYRGVFNKGGNSKPAGNEYTVVLGISSFFTMTVGEGLALVIAFQLLLIMGMITYGVVMDRY